MPSAGTYQGHMARLGVSSAAPRRAQAGTGRGRGSSAAGPGAPRPPAPRQWRRPRTLTRKLNRRLPAPGLGPAVRAVPELRSRGSPPLAPPPVPVAPGGASAEAPQPQVICPQFRAEAVASGTAQQGGMPLVNGAEAARGLAGGAGGLRPQAGRREGRGWSREGRGGTAREGAEGRLPVSSSRPSAALSGHGLGLRGQARHAEAVPRCAQRRQERQRAVRSLAPGKERRNGLKSGQRAGPNTLLDTRGGEDWELRVSCFRALFSLQQREPGLDLGVRRSVSAATLLKHRGKPLH